MLGIYNYTVILTYLGMLSGFAGILCVLEGRLVFPEDECFDYYEDDDEDDDDDYEDDDDDGEGRDEDNDDPFGCVIKKTLSGFEEGPVPF